MGGGCADGVVCVIMTEDSSDGASHGGYAGRLSAALVCPAVDLEIKF